MKKPDAQDRCNAYTTHFVYRGYTASLLKSNYNKKYIREKKNIPTFVMLFSVLCSSFIVQMLKRKQRNVSLWRVQLVLLFFLI